jgi:oligopeptide/dipeptide ABC transporter ATP-binding protein
MIDIGSARPVEDAPALEVDGLSVDLYGLGGVARAVRGVSWSVEPGQMLAIVGESGSGKSVTAKALMGVLDSGASRVRSGSARLAGQDLLTLPRERRRDVYGKTIAMVEQNAITALNPTKRTGRQITETLRVHNRRMDRDTADQRAAELLRQVGIPDPARRARQYPHELSGGMCQRVMIAMAIANNPLVLIADEPTTALDVTIQAQIMDLLVSLMRQRQMAVVLITHDLGLVSEYADKVVVMYGGRVMETGSAVDVISQPAHPYTRRLLEATPNVDAGRSLIPIAGTPATALNIPSGCPFHPRCYMAQDLCRTDRPREITVAEGHISSCHFAADVVNPGRPEGASHD